MIKILGNSKLGVQAAGFAMGDFTVGHATRPDVKSKQFGFESMFPRKDNIDDMFREYFSKHSCDDGFVDLHGELQRLDLRG